MIETNPYRLEEAEWTPGNVYDIIPPGDLSHTGFEYSEGSDNIDEGEVRNSLALGVADFFGQLLGGIGKILGGAIEAGVGILGGIVQGVTGLIGEIASAIGGLIPDGARTTPIKNAVVAVMEPMRSQIFDLGANLTALSDETKLRIDEQKDLIDDANVAIGEAKDLTAAVKKVADQNKKDVASAIAKADAANASLAELAPKVTDAVSKANKASSDVSTLTPKVTSASEEAAKASQDVAALSPKVADAVSKSEKATSDVATLTPQVAAAQSKANSAYAEAGKVRSEVTPKIEAAQTKGENALAVADKAVDWLRNPKEIGASLIAIDPETDKPNWAEHLDPVTAEENPLNLPNAYKTGDNYSRNPRRMPVNVDTSTEYMVSLWVKADKPGSDMTYDVRNQDGELAFNARRKVDGFLDAGDNWRAFWIKNVPTEWTQYKKIATPRETTRTFEFAITYFKHSQGDTQDVIQYVADLQIYPLVPSQLDVDQAQNDAIKANQDILRQQGEINDAQATANLAQKNFNDNQTKWNLASTNATKALADAAKAQTDINAEQTKFNNFQTQFNKDQTKWNAAVDRSIATQNTVNDNFEKWTNGAATAIQANTDATKALARIAGLDIGGRNLLKKSNVNATNTSYRTAFAYFGDSVPEDGEEITISLKGSLGEGKKFFNFYNSGGSTYVDGVAASKRDSNGVYKMVTKWKTNGDDSYLNIYAVPESVNATSTVEWVKLERGNQATDWTPAPEDIPTQAQVDEAQNKAIEANTETIKHQIEINTLFQEQMWTQLDMIEQGEIQSPRVYHQAVGDGPLITNIPSWVGWSSAREYKNTFINFYHRYSDTKKVYWQATGSWEGQVRLTTNWDNGAVDTYVYTIYKDRITRGDKTWSGRTLSNSGGAAFVYHRNTTFEVYPRNLGRQVGVFISTKDDGTGTRWVDEDAPSMDQPSMIRYKSEDMFRLAASVTSDKKVTTRVYQDGEWVKKVYAPDTIIPPSMIWREDMPTGTTYFMETNFLGVDW